MVHIVAELLLNFWRSDQVNHLLVSCEDLGACEEVADHFLPCLICQSWEANILPPGFSKTLGKVSFRKRKYHVFSSRGLTIYCNLIWFLLQMVIEGKKIFSKSSVEDSKVTTV